MSVDLPLPDRPMMQKISPRRTWRLASETPTTQLKSCSTCVFVSPRSRIACMAAGALLPKIFQTDWQSTSTSLVSMFAVLMSLPMGTGVAPVAPPA